MMATAFALREGRSVWPLADGIIQIQSGRSTYSIAFEFKRPNEGVHGLLTAIGQACAYIHKGYDGAVITVPNIYDTHNRPGLYLKEVTDTASPSQQVAVVTYNDADTSLTLPYDGKLTVHKQLQLTFPKAASATQQSTGSTVTTDTQWAHVREGSTVPDAFWKYLQLAKQLSFQAPPEPTPSMPKGLIDAVTRLKPGALPIKFISNSVDDDFKDVVWRNFWFRYMFSDDIAPIWKALGSPYLVNDVPLGIEREDGRGKMKFWSARRDSIKNKLVEDLNVGRKTEADAWEAYAKNVRDRAHSFREDIDSGLEHLGLLETDGRPTELGYKFVDACDRTGSATSGVPRNMLGAALLQNGRLGALLHYIFRLSESKFSLNALEFTQTQNCRPHFDSNGYLHWIEDQLANDLRVMRKVSARGGAARRPLQAELTILSKYGFVTRERYRTGIGLTVNWPAVHEALDYPLS
jgi:hypothetical protein